MAFIQFIFLIIFLFQTDEEAGLLEQVKSQICDNVAMYAQKYDEEFAPHLPSFVTAVWNLLTSTGAEVKYDLVTFTNTTKRKLTFKCSLCNAHYILLNWPLTYSWRLKYSSFCVDQLNDLLKTWSINQYLL